MDHSYVTRKEASSILHCSLKTIDRYVASGKIGAQKQGGQVRLLHADVHKIYTEKHGSGFQNIWEGKSFTVSKELDQERQSLESEKAQIEREKKHIAIEKETHSLLQEAKKEKEVTEDQYSHLKEQAKHSHTFYTQLIADLREEIKEKNGRLEAANYKIGEMQSEINNRIPLLEYRAKDDELVKLKINHTQEQNKLKESIHDLSINIQEEKINKYIYAGLVFFLGILGAIMFFLTL